MDKSLIDILRGHLESGNNAKAIATIVDELRGKPRYDGLYVKAISLRNKQARCSELEDAGLETQAEEMRDAITFHLTKLITELEMSLPPEECKANDKINPILGCLRNMDFEKQDRKFQQIIQRTNFLLLSIRGEKEIGQRWLLHQLLDSYVIKYHDHLHFDFDSMNYDNDLWIDHLLKTLSLKPVDPYFGIKSRQAIKVIMDRLKSNNQCIIFRQCHDYFSSEKFGDFLSHFLLDLNTEYRINKPDNKLIIVFVENTTAAYKIADTESDKCKFSYLEKYESDADSYSKFLSGLNGSGENVELVCLSPIGSLDMDMINTWIDEHAVGCQDIKDLPDFRESVVGYYNESCSDGNPQKMMEFISNKLNYDKWKSY